MNCRVVGGLIFGGYCWAGRPSCRPIRLAIYFSILTCGGCCFLTGSIRITQDRIVRRVLYRGYSSVIYCRTG